MLKTDENGFTIFELVVAMGLAAIMLFSALLGVSQWYGMFSKQNAEMQVLQDLRLAQVKTVEQGCQGIITLHTDERGYSFGCDFLPYSTSTPRVADAEFFSEDLPSTLKISIDSQILFNSRGQVVDENGFYTARTISLSENTGSGYQVFRTGTLTATGFFTYSN